MISTSCGAIIVQLLDEAPAADRADILRDQIRLIEAAAGEKRRRLAEIMVSAIAEAARSLGIELPPGTPDPPEPLPDGDDVGQLEGEIAEMAEALPVMQQALAAIEAGPPVPS